MDNEELRYNENIDTADGRKVVGYAAVVNQPTVIFKDDAGNEYKEVFVSGCFDKTNMDDVVSGITIMIALKFWLGPKIIHCR